MATEDDILAWLQSERAINPQEEDLDDVICKAKIEPSILSWEKIKLEGQSKWLSGDVHIYQLIQKSIKENAPIYKLNTNGNSHTSAEIMFAEKGSYFLKQATKKSVEREGFVYYLGTLCGLQSVMEPTCSLQVGDDKYYAASVMLPPKYKSLSSWRDFNPDAANGMVENMGKSGLAHKMAVFDGVIRNMDRNTGNILTDGTDIKLIDHGRAGITYGKRFIPGYLRCADNSLIKSKNEDAVRLWLGQVRNDSRLFIFHEFINKLDFNFNKSVCEQINDWWTKTAAEYNKKEGL